MVPHFCVVAPSDLACAPVHDAPGRVALESVDRDSGQRRSFSHDEDYELDLCSPARYI